MPDNTAEGAVHVIVLSEPALTSGITVLFVTETVAVEIQPFAGFVIVNV